VPEYINCFMWGFQPHFRSQVEWTFQRAISELGREVEPEVFLIGFLLEGRKGNAICVEPEDGPIDPSELAGVAARAEALYDEDPESKIWHSDARTHDLYHSGLRDRARSTAIREVLEAKLGLHFVVAAPTTVADYRVFTCVGMPVEAVETYPALTRRKVSDGDRIVVSRSLLEAALRALAAESSRALYEPDTGSSLGGFMTPGEVGRIAGERLAIDAAYRADDSAPSTEIFEAINKLATTSYERRVGVGRLILAQRDAPGVDRAVTLKRPVRLRDTRALRKLLEVSSRGRRSVLIDGRVAYGLGTLRDDYDPLTESVFEIVVSGPGTWDLRHAGVSLMAVGYGAPHLPVERLQRSQFDDTATRVFAPVGGCDAARLWDLAMAAADAEHGTMLVVSGEAASEAARLESQALVVERLDAEPDLVAQLSKIDGAILLDPHGGLEAAGVILDGIAGAQGDRSRGARFNSAVRYLDTVDIPTMIVLVSEDGMLDLMPRLRPRIHRAEIAAMFDELRSASAMEPVSPKHFFKAFRRIEAVAFYLNAEQCEEANRLAEDHWERRRAAGATMWTSERPLRPDPVMSDEYLLD
jgi:hypothetical protein